MKINSSTIIAHALLIILVPLTNASARIQKRQQVTPSSSTLRPAITPIISLQPTRSPTASLVLITSLTPTPSASLPQPITLLNSTSLSTSSTSTTSTPITSSTTLPKPLATLSPTPTSTPPPQTGKSLSSGTLAGVCLAGLALVLISAGFLWLVHFRSSGTKKPTPFRRASAAIQQQVQLRRGGHIRIEDYVASQQSMTGTNASHLESWSGFGTESGMGSSRGLVYS